jgi:hypothetical protein
MKKSFTIFFGFIFFSFNSDSFPLPLNGAYTIGSGGDYATIISAVSDIVSQGVNGPVVFNILPGIYTEYVVIDSIPGTSSINTVTIKSQTDNPADVVLQDRLVLNHIANVAIESMSIYNFDIRFNGNANNILIKGNLFKFGRRSITFYSGSNIKILNNTFIAISGPEVYSTYSIHAENCDSLLIEKNNFTAAFHIEPIQLFHSDLFSKIKFQDLFILIPYT